MFNNLATLSFSALLFISLAACSGANSKTPAKVFDARNEVGHVFVLQTSLSQFGCGAKLYLRRYDLRS